MRIVKTHIQFPFYRELYHRMRTARGVMHTNVAGLVTPIICEKSTERLVVEFARIMIEVCVPKCHGFGVKTRNGHTCYAGSINIESDYIQVDIDVFDRHAKMCHGAEYCDVGFSFDNGELDMIYGSCTMIIGSVENAHGLRLYIR